MKIRNDKERIAPGTHSLLNDRNQPIEPVAVKRRYIVNRGEQAALHSHAIIWSNKSRYAADAAPIR